MNVLAYVEAIIRGPKGVTRRCKWLRCPEYFASSVCPVPVPVGVPDLLSAEVGNQLVTLTLRVVTPKGWGVIPLSDDKHVVRNCPTLGGPSLPKTGDVLVAFAPLEGWFEVTL